MRFLKFRLISRIYRPAVGPRENHCPSLSSTTSATLLGGLWVRPVRSPALQAAQTTLDTSKELRCTRVTATAEERNARLIRPQPVMLPLCTLRSAESTTARTVAPRRGEPHAHARTHTNERTLCARIYDHTHTPTHSWPNPACGFPGDTDDFSPSGTLAKDPASS